MDGQNLDNQNKPFSLIFAYIFSLGVNIYHSVRKPIIENKKVIILLRFGSALKMNRNLQWNVQQFKSF